MLVGVLAVTGDKARLAAAAAGDVWVPYPMQPAPGQAWVPWAWIALGLIGVLDAALRHRRQRRPRGEGPQEGLTGGVSGRRGEAHHPAQAALVAGHLEVAASAERPRRRRVPRTSIMPSQ